MPPQTKPSIVFAHGLWADGSCFSKVIPALQAEGHEVVAAQNSLDTLEGDVAAVTRALGRVSSPAILVGHSYGGTVITAAGTDDRVAGLVYIAALAPDDDETSQSLLGKFPDHRRLRPHRSRGRAHLVAPGRHRVLRGRPVRAGAEARLGDPGRTGRGPVQPEGQRRRLEVEAELVHRGQATTAPSTPSCSVSWRSAWARRPYEVDSSHVPMLSNPEPRDRRDPEGGDHSSSVRFGAAKNRPSTVALIGQGTKVALSAPPDLVARRRRDEIRAHD